MSTGESRSRSGRARALLTLAMMLALAAVSTGCATFRSTAVDDSAAGAVHRRTAHSFFWGAIRGDTTYDECSVPGDADGNGLWQVTYDVNGACIAAAALTLGIWMPVTVTYQCAVPRPDYVGIGGPRCGDPGAMPPGAGCVLPGPMRGVPEWIGDTMRPSKGAPEIDLDCEEQATWQNLAENVTAHPRKLCRPKPPTGMTADKRVAPLVALVQEAEKNGLRVRAVGAGWSFSRAAVSDGIMIDMRWFGASLPLPRRGDWAEGTEERFFGHFEAGAAVDAVNLALQNAGYSLMTMGGSAGQTWVGAVSTGTHGGDTLYAAIADYMRALHVVSGEGKRLWIERKSDPLTRGGYARDIGAEFIADDEVFNAAVAGLGTFGVVHSAIIEVQRLESYLLWRQRFDYDAELRHVMETFDFSRWKWPDPVERAFMREEGLAQQNTTAEGALRHFEVVVNPYETGAGARGAFVTSVWDDNRLIVPANASVRYSNINTSIGTVVVQTLVRDSGPDVPTALHLLLPSQYSEITTAVEGPLRTLFPKGIPTGGRPMSMELSLSRRDVNKAMDVILKEIKDHSTGYYYPGVVAFRFSRPTSALLGFTFFSPTVTIEFPTVAGVQGTEEFLTRVHRALDKANIAHSQHLGQWNTYTAEPEGFVKAFGDRVTRFRAAREKVLSPAAQRTFANEYTDKLGITAGAR